MDFQTRKLTCIQESPSIRGACTRELISLHDAAKVQKKITYVLAAGSSRLPGTEERSSSDMVKTTRALSRHGSRWKEGPTLAVKYRLAYGLGAHVKIDYGSRAVEWLK